MAKVSNIISLFENISGRSNVEASDLKRTKSYGNISGKNPTQLKFEKNVQSLSEIEKQIINLETRLRYYEEYEKEKHVKFQYDFFNVFTLIAQNKELDDVQKNKLIKDTQRLLSMLNQKLPVNINKIFEKKKVLYTPSYLTVKPKTEIPEYRPVVRETPKKEILNEFTSFTKETPKEITSNLAEEEENEKKNVKNFEMISVKKLRSKFEKFNETEYNEVKVKPDEASKKPYYGSKVLKRISSIEGNYMNYGNLLNDLNKSKSTSDLLSDNKDIEKDNIIENQEDDHKIEVFNGNNDDILTISDDNIIADEENENVIDGEQNFKGHSVAVGIIMFEKSQTEKLDYLLRETSKYINTDESIDSIDETDDKKFGEIDTESQQEEQKSNNLLLKENKTFSVDIDNESILNDKEENGIVKDEIEENCHHSEKKEAENLDSNNNHGEQTLTENQKENKESHQEGLTKEELENITKKATEYLNSHPDEDEVIKFIEVLEEKSPELCMRQKVNDIEDNILENSNDQILKSSTIYKEIKSENGENITNNKDIENNHESDEEFFIAEEIPIEIKITDHGLNKEPIPNGVVEETLIISNDIRNEKNDIDGSEETIVNESDSLEETVIIFNEEEYVIDNFSKLEEMASELEEMENELWQFQDNTAYSQLTYIDENLNRIQLVLDDINDKNIEVLKTKKEELDLKIDLMYQALAKIVENIQTDEKKENKDSKNENDKNAEDMFNSLVSNVEIEVDEEFERLLNGDYNEK